MTEVVVTMILLGAVIGMIVPLTKRAIDRHEQSQVRRAGLIELSNALERTVADSNSWPAPGDTRTLPVPDTLAARLDEPRLTVAAVPLEGPPAGQRFDAALDWRQPSGRRSAPIRLSAFAFRGDAGELDVEGGSP